jgi:hypothetical protein
LEGKDESQRNLNEYVSTEKMLMENEEETKEG